MQWESLLFVYYSHACLQDQETTSFCPQGLRQVCVSACGNIQIMYLDLRRALQCPRAGHNLFAVRKASGSGLLCSAPSSTTWRVHAPSTTVSYIIKNMEDGVLDLLRILSFPAKTQTKEARAWCTGIALVPAFRQGPWTWVKAVHYLIDMLPGHHVVWWQLSHSPRSMQRSSSSQQQWVPTTMNCSKGWITSTGRRQTRTTRINSMCGYWHRFAPDSGSPIAGWPKSEVRLMAQNKSRGAGGATSAQFFPLTTMSLKPVTHTLLLPLLFPLLISYGVITVGWPGVGKTPFLIVLSLALGRYHTKKNGQPCLRPGWRRAKAIDNFRHKCGQSHEGLILDDPTMDKIEAADLKSWLTPEEDQNCSGRYRSPGSWFQRYRRGG